MENNLLRIGILALIGFILFNILKHTGILSRSYSSNSSTETQYDSQENFAPAEVQPNSENKSQLYDHDFQVLPYPQIATNEQDSYFNSGGSCQANDSGCYSGSVLQAPDLLPKEDNQTAWDETSPKSQGTIGDQNYLESGHHNGVNTVGSTNKNANRQLRSDPLIPKVDIGPWRNSTVTYDSNRKGFEIEA